MQNKAENIFTHTMKTGLVLSIVLIVSEFYVFFVPNSESVGISESLLFSGISMVGLAAQVFCIFYFTRRYRDDVLEGNMNYMAALRYGFYMFFFAGLIFAACVYLCNQFFCVNYVAEKGTFALKLMRQAQYPQGDIDQWLKSLEEVKRLSASRLAWDSLASVMFSGVVMLLFTSIFFRKK